MSGMMNLYKRAAAIGVAGLIVAGTAAPSLAQYLVTPAQPYGVFAPNDPTTARARILNMSPTECWSDEGYGRVQACDAGAGQ